MKKIISLIISGILMISMVGCGDETDMDKAVDYISKKYDYADEIIEKYEDTKFVAIKIPTNEEYPTENLIRYAEEKQNEIQSDMWALGYDVVITVSFINIEDGSYVYVAKADDVYYERLNK